MIDVKFKKLSSSAVTPTYAKDGDAGLDLVSTKLINNTSAQIEYGTDIAIEIPRGYVGLLFPRSSVRKYDIILSNCVGVIDSGYRGEIKLTFNKTNDLDSFTYPIGVKIGQLIILPLPLVNLLEVDVLSDSDRGEGGFGHTGN